MSHKDEVTYKMLSNCRFIISDMWVNAKKIYLWWILLLISNTVSPFIAVLIPTYAVSMVIQAASISRLTFIIGGLSVLITILNFISSRAGAGFTVEQNAHRLKCMCEVEKVTINCSYINLENPNFQMLINHAMELVFSGDTQSGISGFTYALRDIVMNVLGITIFASIMSRVHILLVVLVFIMSVVSSFISRRVSRYEHDMRDMRMNVDQKINFFNEKLTERAYGKEIRTLHTNAWLNEVLDDLIIKRVTILKTIMVRRFGSNAFDVSAKALCDGAALIWIALSVINGKIGVAEFLLYFGAITQVTAFASGLIQKLGDLKRTSYDVGVLREFLATPDARRDNKASRWDEITTKPITIEFDHVFFRYDESETYAIKDLCEKITFREKIAIVGANGAGKTTFVKLLCGLYKPTSGHIYVNGISLADVPMHEIYGLFSALFQDLLLLPFSVAKNISCVDDDETDFSRVRYCLQMAGLECRIPDVSIKLDRVANEDAQELSGGEMQRLLFARALYKQAPILILDEPTAALDPIAESQLYERYSEIAQDCTSIFISHRLASTQFCDRILFFQDGAICERGTHAELLENDGAYAKMFDLQRQYYL